MDVIEEIAAERERQVKQEGWTREHDDKHFAGEMARAAAAYAVNASVAHADGLNFTLSAKSPQGGTHTSLVGSIDVAQLIWPWAEQWWKPSLRRRRDLIKAGALIVAEIERLDRAEQSER